MLKRIYAFVLLLMLTNPMIGMAEVSKSAVTLPFDSLQWKGELFAQPNLKSAIKPITDNSALQRYLDSLGEKEEYQGYLHLPREQRRFDSYIVIEGDRQHLVNIDDNGRTFIQKNIAADWSKSYQEANNHWAMYRIDPLLNLKVSEVQVRYSQLQKKFLITQKLHEQRYLVTSSGEIIEQYNKTFPNPITGYDVNNPDNCFTVIFKSPLVYSGSVKMPLSSLDKSYDDFLSDASEPEGIGYTPVDCVYGYRVQSILLPAAGKNYVALFNSLHTDYLVVFNSEKKFIDMMAIKYEDKNGDIGNFTINKDYSIDLIITSPDGKKRKQTFVINEQGEIEYMHKLFDLTGCKTY